MSREECCGTCKWHKHDSEGDTPAPIESEDTISRKHLLSEIDELMKSPWFNRYKDDGGALHFGYTERKEAVEIVRDLCVKTEPPVTPKPRTGKWIRHTRVENVYDIAGVKTWGIKHQCDQCTFTTIAIEGFGYYDYCPHCGAKMEGVSE